MTDPHDDDLDGCDLDFTEDALADEESGLFVLFADALDPGTGSTVDDVATGWEEVFVHVLELPDALRARGLDVVEVDGWQTRGRPFPQRPDVCIRHWTAGPIQGRTPALRIVTQGRSDLPGPLCQLYQSREPDGNDQIFVVASGIANHAGRGQWLGVSGNANSMGLEIEWSGRPEEVFSQQRKLISELAVRAMLDCARGTNPDDACEHREWATPAGRKVDTNLDGDELRRRIRELGEHPGPGPVEPPAQPTGEVDDEVLDLTEIDTHVVVPGDTLSAIAAIHGLSLAALLQRNPRFQDRPDLIHPGDLVRVS